MKFFLLFQNSIVSFLISGLIILLAGNLLAGCVNLSNREDAKKYAPFLGVQKIAVFIVHWPVFLQKPNSNNLGEDFITSETTFYGPWQKAAQVPARALDVQDVDTTLMSGIVARILEQKGYQVVLANPPLTGGNKTVERLMAQYQQNHTPVDAFMFCYFAPTLFVSHSQEVLQEHTKISYSLDEIVSSLSSGDNSILWVGQRHQDSPGNSMSHAFIYWGMTIFAAATGQPILLQADSRLGGPVRPWIPMCLPAPTKLDYPASPQIIKNLMIDNLKCRLKHEIPFAF
jgi:hypothetical protein